MMDMCLIFMSHVNLYMQLAVSLYTVSLISVYTYDREHAACKLDSCLYVYDLVSIFMSYVLFNMQLLYTMSHASVYNESRFYTHTAASKPSASYAISWSNSCAWHDLSIRETWLIHMRKMTDLYDANDVICIKEMTDHRHDWSWKWLDGNDWSKWCQGLFSQRVCGVPVTLHLPASHEYDMNPSYLRHDSFICVSWLSPQRLRRVQSGHMSIDAKHHVSTNTHHTCHVSTYNESYPRTHTHSTASTPPASYPTPWSNSGKGHEW